MGLRFTDYRGPGENVWAVWDKMEIQLGSMQNETILKARKKMSFPSFDRLASSDFYSKMLTIVSYYFPSNISYKLIQNGLHN